MILPWKTRFLWAIALVCLAGCGWNRPNRPYVPRDGDWALKAEKHLPPDRLWTEYNGADQLYIGYGCRSAALLDFAHRTHPWTLRCSIFDQSTTEGARGLFDYYREGIDNEADAARTIGDATYLWSSPESRCWIVGFRKGRYMAELSLAEGGDAKAPLALEAREAVLEVAAQLATAY